MPRSDSREVISRSASWKRVNPAGTISLGGTNWTITLSSKLNLRSNSKGKAMEIEEKKTANSEFHVPQEQTGSQPSKETSEEGTTKGTPKDGVDNYGAELDEAFHKASSAFETFASTSKKAYEVLIGDCNAFIEEKKIFETMTKRLKETQFSNIITLNIGGEKYSSGLPTFEKWKDSYFGKMFSGRIVLEKSPDGSFFIDRDGSLFRHILNYLRTEKITSAMKQLAEELIDEAKFFGLSALEIALSAPTTEANSEDSVPMQKSEKVNDAGLREKIEHNALKQKEILEVAADELSICNDLLKTSITLTEMKKQNFEKIAKKLEDVHFSDVVKLNVGGHIFVTSITTLQKDPDSMLAAMFSGRFDVVKQDDGSYFIDRDGTHFRHILNFLRTGGVPRDVLNDFGEELETEADYYNLRGLANMVAKLRPVKINDNGEVIITSMETLRKDQEFAKFLFSEQGAVQKIEDAFVLPPPKHHIAEVIEFLHHGELPFDVKCKLRDCLLATAIRFHITTLQKLFDGFAMSNILNKQEIYINILNTWFETKKINLAPVLIYSAEEDGWTATEFHKRCDGKGASLVLIESTAGFIFGGFSPRGWTTSRSGGERNAFLFSLKSPEWQKPVLMPLNENSGSYHASGNGPHFYDWFLGQFHLSIASEANSNNSSYTYNNGILLPESVPKTNTFLAGQQFFLVKQLEVFAV